MVCRPSFVCFGLLVCVAACAKPAQLPPSQAAPRALSSEEVRVWDGYLESIDALLRGATSRTPGLVVLEVRTRLAENLATTSKAKAELPRSLAMRAGHLLAALDALFARLSTEARGVTTPNRAPGDGLGGARRTRSDASASSAALTPLTREGSDVTSARAYATGDVSAFALEAPEPPRRLVRPKRTTGTRGELLAAAAPSSIDSSAHAHDTDADISEAEVDDGGPAVDLALPVPPPKSVLRWPLATARLTSRFGHRRDPIHGRLSFHDGVDLSAPRGSLVMASASGRVTFAGRRGGGGNVVVVEHWPGLKTVYAHLDHIAVARGAQLRSGDVVGLVGSTGRATGPHLHFVVRREGRSVDPMMMVGRSREELIGANP